MNNLLIGLSDNIAINKDKIKLWSQSYRKVSNGDIVLLCGNMNDDDKRLCDSLNIQYKNVIINNTRYINHERLIHIQEYLISSNYDMVLSTDVFDVVFQNDPFVKLDNNYDIFIGAEGVLISQEPWNYDNIKRLFPGELSKCVNQEILCSGIIAGKKLSMINLYRDMYSLCKNSTNNHNIQDQAALNVLFANNKIPKLKVFNLSDNWVVHCAVAGPTEFFDSWGFKNNLKYDAPKLINGSICSSRGVKYDIVHQFNRIQEWYKTLRQNYE